MNPQWPGSPPGPPPPPGGPPPPPRSGGGALVPLLIFGIVGVLALVGVGVFFIVNEDDDDPGGSSAVPAYTPEPVAPSTPASLPTSEPTPSSGGGPDPASILKPTIRTAKGNTFTRAGTRTESCTSRANPTLASTLRGNPCVQPMHSAVYADPTRKIITVVSIARFADPGDAATVSRATTRKGWPKLLAPSDASGLPKPADPPYWTRSWTQGSHVVYAQSYWASGAPTGGRSGSVFTTAGELGVEITNVLLWTD